MTRPNRVNSTEYKHYFNCYKITLDKNILSLTVEEHQRGCKCLNLRVYASFSSFKNVVWKPSLNFFSTFFIEFLWQVVLLI